MDTLFPSALPIGDIRVVPATVLAPMAGVTDTVFRRFIRNLGGCGLIMTEFTSSHGIKATAGKKKPTRTLKYLTFSAEEHPISAQLFGADPEVMADAASITSCFRSRRRTPESNLSDRHAGRFNVA